MNENTFWSLIDASDGLPWSEKKDRILLHLRSLSLEDIIQYSVIFGEQRRKAFTPAILCGAYLLSKGWLSYDAFLDFSDCLVATSSRTFHAVVADAENLAAHPELGACPEMHFSQLGIDAYEMRGGDASLLVEKIEAARVSPRSQILYKGKIDLEIISREAAAELVPGLLEKFGKEAFG